MSWNYRIIKKTTNDEEDYYKIHEVYYDENDNIMFWSEDSVDPHGLNLDELKYDLDLMYKAFDKPVLYIENDKLKEVDDLTFEVCDGLDREQAFKLIKGIDMYQEDWDFSLKIYEYFKKIKDVYDKEVKEFEDRFEQSETKD